MIKRLFLLALFLPSAVLGQAPAVPAPAAPKEQPAAVIRLERVKDFGQSQDWTGLFRNYESRGSYKGVVRLPDGRLLVADTRTYNFLIFDARGRFLGKFWAKGRRKASSKTAYNRPEWASLWDGRLLFVSELGRVRVFDLDGRQVRTAVVDHPVSCLAPLSETTVAVAGWVLQADASSRFIIALVDLSTGRETVLRDMLEDMPEPVRTKDGRIVRARAPYDRIRPFVRALGPDAFAAGFSNWPEIEVFDAAGKPVRLFRLRGEPAAMVATMEDLGRYADPYDSSNKSRFRGQFFVAPYDPDRGIRFFNFVLDDKGRFLVFSFPESGADPVLRIYSSVGDLLKEARLEAGDLKIAFSPGEAGPVFDGECLITLAEEKEAKGVPLRLVKLRMIGL